MNRGKPRTKGARMLGFLASVLHLFRDHVFTRWFVLILFVFTIVTGVTGYECARRESDFWDSLYRTIQLFGLNFSPLEEAARGPGIGGNAHCWLIEISRYLGALTLGFGVVALFYTRLRDVWKLLIQSQIQNRKRVVLLGFGSVNTALARVLTDHNVPITVISKQFTEADRAMARQHDIVLITGDLMDVGTLKQAKIGKAAHIVVAAGDDVTNVEIGTAAAGFAEVFQRQKDNIENQNAKGEIAARPYGANKFGMPVVKVHLSSTRTLADLTEARDIAYAKGGAASFFSIKSDSARKLVREAEFTRVARDKGQERVHIVMCGMGDQGEALLVEILLNSFALHVKNGVADVLKPPRLTLMDVDGEAKLRARLKAHRPRLFDGSIPAEACPEFMFLDADAMSLCFDSDQRLNAIEDACPVTAWIFACGRDNVNLAAAMRLEIAMHQLKRDPAPIYARLWSADIAVGNMSAEIALEERNPLLFTRPFGAVSQVMPESTIVRHVLHDEEHGSTDTGLETEDALAILLHADYWETAKKIDEDAVARIVDAGALDPSKTANLGDAASRFTRAWHALPENVKEANFRAVRHMPIKFAGLGLDWRRGRLFPKIETELGEKLVGFIGSVEKGSEPNTYIYSSILDPIISSACGQSGEDAVHKFVNAIAKAEHSRWMIDRALEGWRQAPDKNRDNRRRLHSKMIEFGDIGQDRELDLNGLRKAIRFLGQPEQTKVNRPIAMLRKIAVITVTNGEINDQVPKQDALREATELQIVVGGSGATGEHLRFDATARVLECVKEWLSPSSIRLHFLLDVPIDPRTLTDEESEKYGENFLHWANVVSELTDISRKRVPDIEIRVTRRYRRVANSKTV